MAQILNNTYEILELVGKGGMSTVFKARHIRLNTVVAVKSVRKNQAVDLLAEVSILTKLNHPNLVRVMDVFEDDRLIYIVMDYIEGEDLQHVIKREKKIPEEKVREWFITLAEVLGYLHSRVPPIIYRDMKPANIILQKDGTLKLVDFGIAREYKANASGDTTYIGTSGFAAPEQFGLAQSDARTDIYSLGMTMYCLATGKSPNEPPYVYLPARQLNPDISEDLEKIIEKCIQISQDERYQSAEELLSDLRNESELPANTAGSRPVKKEEGHTVLSDKGSTGQGKKRMAPLILTALIVIAAGIGAVFKLTGGLPAGSGSKDPAGSSADQGNNTETSDISDTGNDSEESREGSSVVSEPDDEETAVSNDPAGAENKDTGMKTYKIGAAFYDFNDNFTTLYRYELADYFKSLETDHVRYEVQIADSKNDAAEQYNQVDSFIAEGMDAIILELVQTSTADAMIEKTVKAGIPLILISREPPGDNGDESFRGILDNPSVCFVGEDKQQCGTFQGEIILEQPDHGDINGDGKISYLMIEGDPENIDAQYRTQYSVSALREAGYEAECIDDRIANWDQVKAQEACANALAQYGDRIEVVFCNNDAMALGAWASIKAAGRTVGQDIYLVGVDGLDEIVEMIGQGEMTGTVVRDCEGQAHTAADVTIKLILGEPVENYYRVDYFKVMK